MKLRIILLASYISATPLFLAALIFYSLSLLHQTNYNIGNVDLLNKKVEFRALPEVRGEVTSQIYPQEGRVTVLKEFLGKYKSPLLPFAQKIVDTADEYDIDYRLIPAIAMQESTLCKKIPKESYNCWGFGVYGGKVTRFDNYNEAIETVTKALARDYKSRGLEDPHEIMTRYTPGSNGSWAESVSYTMERIGQAL